MKVDENLSDMKVRLAQQLFEVEDLDVLAEVQAILDRALKDGEWYDSLTDEDRAEVDESEADVAAGRVFTTEEVLRDARPWRK
jgi:predicted transcriptional regulator